MMISLTTFVIGYLAFIFIARGCVELSVYIEERRERKNDLPGAATLNKSANKSIQRYYNRKSA